MRHYQDITTAAALVKLLANVGRMVLFADFRDEAVHARGDVGWGLPVGAAIAPDVPWS